MTTHDTMLADLRRLHEAATPPTWSTYELPDQPSIVTSDVGDVVCRPPAPRDIRPTWDTDSALIAALRNALPALLARLEAAERLERAVWAYAQELPTEGDAKNEGAMNEGRCSTSTARGLQVREALADCQRAKRGEA